MSGSRWLQVVVFSFGAVLGFHALGEDAISSIPVSKNYVLRTWGPDEGLPNFDVFGITQTPDGYLWSAVGKGLARFDGARFTFFSPSHVPGVNSGRMVFTARDGSLWAGMSNGEVVRYRGGTSESIRAPSPNDGWITSFAEAADGSIWFGFETPARVGCWKDGKVSLFEGKDGIREGRSTCVSSSENGKIWYSNFNGCGVFDGTRFQEIEPEYHQYVKLARARGGGMWAIRDSWLVRYFENGRRENVRNLADLSIETLFEDSLGNLWIGSHNKGLIRFWNGKLERVPVSDVWIASIFEDREGNLWVGTRGGGLSCLRSRFLFLRQTQDGLPYNETYSLCQDSEGKIWVAGWNYSLSVARDSKNQSFVAVEGAKFPAIMALCPDLSGGLWLGSLRGLFYWRNGKMEPPIISDQVTSILLDHQGNLWIGAIYGGLLRYKDGVIERFPEKDGLTHPRALAEDADGRLWIGTETGRIFRREKTQFIPIPLPENPSSQVRFIVPDGKDATWIGLAGDGLYRWRAGQATHLRYNVGMDLTKVSSLIIDESGNFWVGTELGLYRIERKEMESAADGHQSLMHYSHYEKNDGLSNAKFSYGFRNAATRTRDGHVWFATYRGALEVIPEQENRRMSPALQLLMEEIQVNGKPMLFSGGDFVLPPQVSLLQIRYTLPQLSSPEQIQFQYRLVKTGNEDWIHADTQRVATFTNLAAGRYRFEVESIDGSGRLLPQTAVLAFTVEAAWWETVWFRLGAIFISGLLLTFLVLAIVKRRVRRRIQRLEQEHALERERTRIARDIHDELGSRLTQIAITSKLAKVDPEAMLSHVGEIASIAHQTAESIDEIVWAVNPRHDTIDSLLEYLGQYTLDFITSSGMECEIEIPEEVPKVSLSSRHRHHLFLAVKEALNNVVKHSGATAVRLIVELSRKSLKVIVSDNGHGWKLGRERVGADGLRNMQDRMKELGGECRLESELGKGTLVVFDLPLVIEKGKA